MSRPGAAGRTPSGQQPARSFGAEAARYAAVRPSYPTAAVDHALAGSAPGRMPERILDLAAGTSKLTRSLIGRAGEVLAVEPDPQMLAELRVRVPEATALTGSAEAIPLPDASVDAVMVGQAFHWFQRPQAELEIARVLRPGGYSG